MENSSLKPVVINKHHTFILPPDSVYIGRGSKWGNPFIINKHGNRAEVVEKYRQHVEGNPQLRADAARELKGKNLICFCAPLKCHGDILIQIANQRDVTTDLGPINE